MLNRRGRGGIAECAEKRMNSLRTLRIFLSELCGYFLHAEALNRESMKSIGYDLSIFDKISLAIFSSILLFLVFRYSNQLSNLWIPVLLYSFYLLNLSRKRYLYIDGNSFIIRGIFNSRRIKTEEFLNVSSAGIASYFAAYCLVNFTNGQSIKILASTKNLKEVEGSIKKQISDLSA